MQTKEETEIIRKRGKGESERSEVGVDFDLETP